MTNPTFPGEERAVRMAEYRARFLSWQLGRKVVAPTHPNVADNDHWWHKPLRYADTGEPI